VPAASTVDARRAKYRLNLSLAALQRLRSSGPTYSHWDDHEFINDFSRAENGDDVYNAGRQAFLDYAIAHSKATFKVNVNEVPIQQFYALPYDRWEGTPRSARSSSTSSTTT
jgi:hypothetical protein